MTKLAFLYPDFFPVKGGASLHGFYLAKELTKLNYFLYTFNSKETGFTCNFKYNFFSVLKAIIKADVVYLRLSPLGKSMYLPRIIKWLNKKLIIELNGPTDEYIISHNFSLEKILELDSRLSKTIALSDAVITVSEEMKEYIAQYLHYKDAIVIHNGGFKIEEDVPHQSSKLEELFFAKKKLYKKTILWSGTDYPWQGYLKVQELIEKSNSDFLFIIVCNNNVYEKYYKKFENTLAFPDAPREFVDFLIKNADIGLALYGDYSWTRFQKFYNSSLKFFEYLANDLGVIASPLGHMATTNCENLLLSEDISEMLLFIKNYKKKQVVNYRSWANVAQETDLVIKKIWNEN